MDRDLLLLIQKYFGNIGKISKTNEKFTVEFRVNILSELINVIIPHFNKYNLITNKHSDFILFRNIVLLMHESKYKNIEGLQLVLNNRASLNWALTNNLKLAFPNTVPVKRFFIENKLENISPQWLAGFCTGESNLFIAIINSNKNMSHYVFLYLKIIEILYY